MRYPTKWALAMRAELGTPTDRLSPEECVVVRQRDVSWSRTRVEGYDRWGTLILPGNQLYIAIPIMEADFCTGFPNERLRLAAQKCITAGSRDSNATNVWCDCLMAGRSLGLLSRLNRLRFLRGYAESETSFKAREGAPESIYLDVQRLAHLSPVEEEPAPIPVPEPIPIPEPKNPPKKGKQKDMSEQTKAEPKTAAPAKVTIKLEGVSPLGQAIWPSIEPIMEARLSVLRGEILSKEIRPMEITIADRPKVELEGEHLHPAVMEALAAVGRGEDLFLVGPPGSGKTYMAEQLAKMLGYETAMISFNEQTMSSDIFGRYVVNDKGGMDWHDGPVPAAFRSGKTVIIMDEVDRANPNTVDGLNSAIANRRCNLPQRRESLRSTEVVFVACANAYAADAQNTSSNTLAASFYDRFWRMEIGYDKGLEERFLSFNMPLLQKLWAIRDAVVEHKLRRHVSTRFVIRAARASKGGMKNEDVLKQLVLGWRKEEKDKLKNLLPGGA